MAYKGGHLVSSQSVFDDVTKRFGGLGKLLKPDEL
jgi:hypothetical protein